MNENYPPKTPEPGAPPMTVYPTARSHRIQGVFALFSHSSRSTPSVAAQSHALNITHARARADNRWPSAVLSSTGYVCGRLSTGWAQSTRWA
jgi:hypothetical protein